MRNDLNSVLWTGEAGQAAINLVGQAAFAWLKPIAEVTLSDYVRQYLAEFEPETRKYNPYEIRLNISIANDLVNRCLTRRTQIYEVEALALQAALLYKKQIETLASDQFQLELDTKVKLKALELPFDKTVSTQLENRHESIKGEIDSRIALHNLSGSPLNYGEQTIFTRKLYANNIKTILERVAAIRSGIKLCYGLSEEDLPALDRTEEQSDDLEKIVWWLRAIVTGIELAENIQSESSVYLPFVALSGRNGAGDYGDVIKRFMTDGSIMLDVNLNCLMQGGLASYVEVNGKTSLRITGVAVALRVSVPILQTVGVTDDSARDNQTRDNRISFCRSLGFKCTVVAPEQQVDGFTRTLDLGVLPIGVNEVELAHFQVGDPGPLRNLSPLGIWQIHVKPEASTGTHSVLGLAHRPLDLTYLREFALSEAASYIEPVLCLTMSQ